MDICRSIASFVNEHPNVKNHIHEFINIAEGYVFVVIPTMCETRFAQYLHLHLEGILTNIKVLIAALPSLAANPQLSDKSTSILKYITNESFVAKVMIISDTYKKIALLVKEAQGETFGPFQYFSLIEQLKEAVAPTELSPVVKDLLREGTFDYNNSRSVTTYTGINLRESAIFLKKTRCINSIEEGIFINDINAWYEAINSQIDKYLQVPEIMKLSAEAFQLQRDDNSATYTKIQSVRKMFALSNAEFKKCAAECTGMQECSCLSDEYTRFMTHFTGHFQPISNFKLSYMANTSESLIYVEAFAFLIFHTYNKYILLIET